MNPMLQIVLNKPAFCASGECLIGYDRHVIKEIFLIPALATAVLESWCENIKTYKDCILEYIDELGTFTYSPCNKDFEIMISENFDVNISTLEYRWTHWPYSTPVENNALVFLDSLGLM